MSFLYLVQFQSSQNVEPLKKYSFFQLLMTIQCTNEKLNAHIKLNLNTSIIVGQNLLRKINGSRTFMYL